MIGLAALTLFVVGPLAGSVDDDEDGSPDIPVVVSDSVLLLDLLADGGVDQHSRNTQAGAPSGYLRSSSPSTRVIDFKLVPVDAGSGLHSCCSLRC